MDTTALFNISYGIYVIGSTLDGKNTGCVVDAFIQATSTPVPSVILCSINTNQTTEAIKQTKAFNVSVLGTKVDPFVIGNFGFQSGRDVDKWANVPFELVDDLPVLEEAVAYYCCKVTDYKELPDYTLFYCEVTDALQGEGQPLIYADYKKDMEAKTLESFNLYKQTGVAPEPPAKWICTICRYIYTGEVPFEELPDNWRCPKCGSPKSDFVKM